MKSKTTWAGIAAILTGFGTALSLYLNGQAGEAAAALLGGLATGAGLIFAQDARKGGQDG